MDEFVDNLNKKTEKTAAAGWDAVENNIDAGVQQMKEKFTTRPGTSPQSRHREGPIARTIEQQTAKLPSDVFLWAALGSIAMSLIFRFAGEDRKANFIGHWAPTFLSLGIYNKLVKLHGSDAA